MLVITRITLGSVGDHQMGVHENWELPDNEIVFRCVAAGSYRVEVSR